MQALFLIFLKKFFRKAGKPYFMRVCGVKNFLKKCFGRAGKRMMLQKSVKYVKM